ncbi:MAG: response regulator [Synergistaceae bacterium]|nr:response regulator [Synergistaceae bacterium]
MVMTFAETLRRMRIERDISQQQLASNLFVSRACVANWESGRRVPDAVLISRIAEIFNVDVSMLLSFPASGADHPNVIVVADEELILDGEMATLAEVIPKAEIAGFLKASEAVEFAKTNRVALAFLDIELGRHSGLELCRELTEINKLTNIIFLTGYPDYALEAWDTQACGFLVKPLRRDAVIDSLSKLRHPIAGLKY